MKLCNIAVAGVIIASAFTTMVHGADIFRDKSGIAHVYGRDNADLFYGYGYLAGQDRLFQLEMRKRQAYGRMAEMLGATDTDRWPEKFIEKDIVARDELSFATIGNQILSLSAKERTILSSYTAGLNRAVEEALKDKSKQTRQFAAHNISPTPWTEYDVIVTSSSILAYYSNFSFQLHNLKLYEYLAKAFPETCDDVFEQFLWKTDKNTITTSNDHAEINSPPEFGSALGCMKGGVPNGLVLQSEKASALTGPAYAAYTEPRRASMAWAVGRKKAKGARTIFLNGPQVGWHRPSYYYTVGLHGGDFNFVGMAPYAMLAMEVGVNRHYSWGMTAGLGPQSVVYQEKLDNNRAFYHHDARWKKVESRVETIKVKNSVDRKVTFRRTVHGPMIWSGSKQLDYSISMPWWGHEAESVMAWTNMAAASSEAEWRKQAQKFAFNYNWFYADNEGKVGFYYTGRFPVRPPEQDLRLPLSGTGEYDITEYIPTAENPSYMTRSFISNFNNKPVEDFPNAGLYWEQWGVGSQAEILLELVTQKDRLDWDDVWAINSEISVRDVNAPHLVKFIDKARAKMAENSKELKAVNLIIAWDQRRRDTNNDGYFDHAGQTIFDAWLPLMVSKTITPTLKTADKSVSRVWTSAGYQTRAPRLEEHPTAGTLVTIQALYGRERKNGIPYRHDLFDKKDHLDIVIEALVEAVGILEKSDRFKDIAKMEDWRTPVVKQTFFPTNTNRIPTWFNGRPLEGDIYANRGAINLQTQYDQKGNLVQMGFVNPMGGSEFVPPDGNETDAQAAAFHLKEYGAFTLSPFHLMDSLPPDVAVQKISR